MQSHVPIDSYDDCNCHLKFRPSRSTASARTASDSYPGARCAIGCRRFGSRSARRKALAPQMASLVQECAPGAGLCGLRKPRSGFRLHHLRAHMGIHLRLLPRVLRGASSPAHRRLLSLSLKTGIVFRRSVKTERDSLALGGDESGNRPAESPRPPVAQYGHSRIEYQRVENLVPAAYSPNAPTRS